MRITYPFDDWSRDSKLKAFLISNSIEIINIVLKISKYFISLIKMKYLG